MGKHKHFKAMGFLHTSCLALIHAISKTWDERISMLREKYEKKQTFQSYAFFLHISREAEIHAIPKP